MTPLEYPTMEEIEEAPPPVIVRWYRQLRGPVGEEEIRIKHAISDRYLKFREEHPHQFQKVVNGTPPPEVARARASDPQTSHDAAAKVKTTRHQQLVLRGMRVLHKHGDDAVTDEQIRDIVYKNIPADEKKPSEESLRSRRATLARPFDPENPEAGGFDPVLIELADENKGTTELGNKAQRWRLTPEGNAVALQLARAAAKDQ